MFRVGPSQRVVVHSGAPSGRGNEAKEGLAINSVGVHTDSRNQIPAKRGRETLGLCSCSGCKKRPLRVFRETAGIGDDEGGSLPTEIDAVFLQG